MNVSVFRRRSLPPSPPPSPPPARMNCVTSYFSSLNPCFRTYRVRLAWNDSFKLLIQHYHNLRRGLRFLNDIHDRGQWILNNLITLLCCKIFFNAMNSINKFFTLFRNALCWKVVHSCPVSQNSNAVNQCKNSRLQKNPWCFKVVKCFVS